MSLGLYAHLPFCTNHCTYCAFAISTDISLQDRYVDALVREIGARATGQAADSIYFGGGTPSRTSLENLRRLASAIRRAFDVAPDAEFSMEANPEDITSDSLASWRSLGVNRISIGVQSFHDSELQPLGRQHGAEKARAAVALTAATGVRTNLDLILGLPGQTEASFIETLEIATGLGAGHISLYMLDLEEHSPLRVQLDRGRVTLPDDELVARLYVHAIERLAATGLHQYEISNFARSGEACRHNLRYWSRGEYLGFGLGAHSFAGATRFANTRDIRRYIDESPHASDFSESIGGEESKRETLFLRLRQTSGIDYAEVERLCGLEGTEWVDRGLRDGWLQQEGGRVAFTPSGFLLSNEYISQLF
jgi:oxygen-independent coproporphyrinogen-3 oxidase